MLEALSRAGGEGGDQRLTRIAMVCNLPYDRFQEYLADLQARGLVERDNPFRLTPQGRTLLETYKAWRESLRLFGMGPAE